MACSKFLVCQDISRGSGPDSCNLNPDPHCCSQHYNTPRGHCYCLDFSTQPGGSLACPEREPSCTQGSILCSLKAFLPTKLYTQAWGPLVCKPWQKLPSKEFTKYSSFELPLPPMFIVSLFLVLEPQVQSYQFMLTVCLQLYTFLRFFCTHFARK